VGPRASHFVHTAIFFILRNYEMKAEIYCFVNFMIAKYGISYIIIGRKLPIVESLSSQMKHLIFISLVWDERYSSGPNNTFRPERKYLFHTGRKDLMRGIISSDYDIKLFIFGYHKNHETIYFLFHFVITQ
jgi:hypothetical protein